MPVPFALIGRAAAAAEGAAIRAGGSRIAGQIAAREAAGRAGMRQPGFLSNLRSAGWEISSWVELLERSSKSLIPSVTHKITVQAQGGPATHLSAVSHLALATAFGLIPFSPKWLSTSVISVTVEHTTNTVLVEFGYKSWTTGDIVSRMMKGVREQIEKSAQKVGEGATKLKSGDPDTVREGADDIKFGLAPWFIGLLPGLLRRGVTGAQKVPPNWNAGPGLKNSGGTGEQPTIPDNRVQDPQRPAENGDKKKAFEETEIKASVISGAIGAMSIYRLGRHTIRGGQPFGLFDPGDAQRPEPFKSMIGKPILTRDAAANPAPPRGTAAVSGLDLRTLVAQVLHDPGVRPPLPQTDKGPPMVESELLGK